MKKSKIVLPLTILTVCLLIITACTKQSNEKTEVETIAKETSSLVSTDPDANETSTNETNALETMVPGLYNDNKDDGDYFESIAKLGDLGNNRSNVEYPTMEHLAYIYIVDSKGSGNPEHSLLVDLKYKKAYYSENLEFLTDGFWSGLYTEINLSQTDIETIAGFPSVQGVLNWEDYYPSEYGDTYWVVSLYFDDGSYFQSGGEYYPDEYEKLEEDIWPLLSDKTGEELWWMRGRP